MFHYCVYEQPLGPNPNEAWVTKAEEGQEIYQSGWDAMEEYVLSGGDGD